MHLNELPERLFKILSHPSFLAMKGLANEVPIFIQTYEPARRRKLFSVKAAEVRRKARWMDSC